MQNLEFYITPTLTGPQVLIPQPDNWRDLQLELSYENDAPETVLNATKLIFKGGNAAIMDNWLKSGITGGPGIFVGIPLQIKVCNTLDVVFDGIIDLTDPDTKFTCDIVQVKIRDWRVDMVTEEMSSVTYAYLAAPVSLGGAGVIIPEADYLGGDYVVVPYQRNDLPDGVEFVTTGMSIYGIANLLKEAIQDLIDETGAIIAAAATLGLGGVIVAAFELIATILWTAFLIIAIFLIIRAMFDYLVAPVFNKLGMYARVLIQKACDYFQIGFESTILNDPSSPYYQTVVLPQKQAWVTNQSFTKNMMQGLLGLFSGMGQTVNKRMEYDDLYNLHNNNSLGAGEQTLAAYGYYDGTPSDLIASLEKVFNAKAKIIANPVTGQPVLHFERWDYQYNTPQFTMPNISDQAPFNSHGPFNNSGESRSAFGTNASELQASYFIKYAMDDSDLNTYNYYEGTSCMATTQLIPSSTYYTTPTGTALPSSNYAILLKNLADIEFEFAQAYRKDKLTAVEEVLNNIFSPIAGVINTFISGVNTIISTVNHVLPRKWHINTITPLNTLPPFAHTGQMLLSQDTTGQPKILIVDNTLTTYTYSGSTDYAGRSFSGNNISSVSKGLLGARYLMRNFHWSSLPISTVPTQFYTINIPLSTGNFLALPIPWTPNLTNSLGSVNQYPAPGSSYYNQWLTYKDQLVPICCGDFQLVQNNNCIKTVDGTTAKVDSIKWNVFKGLANIDYREQKIYSSNMQVTFIVDGQTFVANGSL
jgi:hypothetical protein